jgi:hypothetical protein
VTALKIFKHKEEKKLEKKLKSFIKKEFTRLVCLSAESKEEFKMNELNQDTPVPASKNRIHDDRKFSK